MKKWFLLLAAMLVIGCTPVMASVDIAKTFPDPAFRSIISKFDLDGDGFLTDTEIKKVTEIDCKKNQSIKDLSGIEVLTSLTSLSCWQCPITKLNLSANTMLEYLDCCETKLTSLDVTHNLNIHQLWAYGNAFTTLDLSFCPFLVKAANNGVYNNDKNNGSAYSFADEETSSYLVIDKKVTVSLGNGKYIKPADGSESSSALSPKASDTLDVGEEREYSNNVTIAGSLIDGYFIAQSSNHNVVTASSARTGNIIYANAVQYYFSVWIKGVGPGTATVTLYNKDKTIKLWEKTVTVRGNATGNGNKTSGGSSTGGKNATSGGNSSSSSKAETKLATKLTAKAKSFKAATKTKKYVATLKDAKGKAVTNVKLTLKVNKKTYTATTNSKGKATIKIKNLTKKGKYNATIKCAGNKSYKAVSRKVKITVK